jgi:hypothetical protein
VLGHVRAKLRFHSGLRLGVVEVPKGVYLKVARNMLTILDVP